MLSCFSCIWLCNPIDCSPPGSTVHGILQAKYWSRLPCPSPGGLPNPGIEPVSLMSLALAGGLFTTSTTWEAQRMILIVELASGTDTSKWDATSVFRPNTNHILHFLQKNTCYVCLFPIFSVILLLIEYIQGNVLGMSVTWLRQRSLIASFFGLWCCCNLSTVPQVVLVNINMGKLIFPIEQRTIGQDIMRPLATYTVMLQ